MTFTFAIAALIGFAAMGHAQTSNATCDRTVQTEVATNGPYYVTNTPHVVNLNRWNMPGSLMRVAVQVVDVTGKPIPSAVVEIWHADNSGNYHPQAQGHYEDFDDDEVNLRGTLVADANGEFTVSSIKPAIYSGRRRHIHWRASTPAGTQLFDNVTTQSYWLDEKGTTEDTSDGTDSNANACRWLTFVTDPDGATTSRFIITLPGWGVGAPAVADGAGMGGPGGMGGMGMPPGGSMPGGSLSTTSTSSSTSGGSDSNSGVALTDSTTVAATTADSATSGASALIFVSGFVYALSAVANFI